MEDGANEALALEAAYSFLEEGRYTTEQGGWGAENTAKRKKQKQKLYREVENGNSVWLNGMV